MTDLAWAHVLRGAPWLGDAPLVLDHRGRFQRRLLRELGDARAADEWLRDEVRAVESGGRLDALRAEFEDPGACPATALELWRQLDALGYAAEAQSVARAQFARDPEREEPATEALAFDLWERGVERHVNAQDWMADWNPAAERRFEREVCVPYREVLGLARHASTRERVAVRLGLWAPAP